MGEVDSRRPRNLGAPNGGLNFGGAFEVRMHRTHSDIMGRRIFLAWASTVPYHPCLKRAMVTDLFKCKENGPAEITCAKLNKTFINFLSEEEIRGRNLHPKTSSAAFSSYLRLATVNPFFSSMGRKYLLVGLK